MSDLVVDAAIVLKWFRSQGETHVDAARSLRAAFGAGRLTVHAPPFLKLEILNIAGRRWGWERSRLTPLVQSLEEMGITFVEPDMERTAHWTSAGLTAYDACYVAVADQLDLRLVTDDAGILDVAPALSVSLPDAARTLTSDEPTEATEA